jgi:4-amino-4-deoxy-L-arabinose transferase-like glycosyltransferase
MILTFLRRHSTLALVILWLGLEIPFLPTAFRIDEPYYLAIAQQIARFPTDPYGFQINWLGTPKRVSETFANPPLVPVWIAAWERLFPRNEYSVHLAMLILGLLSIHGFVLLAKRYQVNPSLAVLLFCFSPAFFLGSQVVMFDVPMLSLLLLGVAYALIYQETGQKSAWGVAFAASFLCPLTKYNGMVIMPLLLLLLVDSRRRIGISVLTAAPMGSFIFWNLLTWKKYGRPNVLLLFDLQKNLEKSKVVFGHEMGILVATGLGAVSIALPMLLFQVKHLRKMYPFGIPLVFAFAFLWARYQTHYSIVSAILTGVGVCIFFMLIDVVRRQIWTDLISQNLKSILLLLWFSLGVLMQFGIAATSVRYTLIMTPAAILIVLTFLKVSDLRPTHAVLTSALLLSVLLSLSIAIGDAEIANRYRQIILHRIAPQTDEIRNRFYFAGHWGFHYYAEEVGGIALDTSRPQNYEPGDLVAVAQNAWPGLRSLQLPPGLKLETSIERFVPRWPVNTITCDGGANFYGNRLASCERPTLLPFALGQFTSEEFLFFRILKPVEPTHPVSFQGQGLRIQNKTL